jgi:hypothetical protein
VVVDALQKGPTVASGGLGSSATSSTKHIYTAYEIAALQGYCGVTQARGIPRIWLTFQTTQKAEEVRANLKEGMQAFAQMHNCELDGGVFFKKKTLRGHSSSQVCRDGSLHPGMPTNQCSRERTLHPT